MEKGKNGVECHAASHVGRVGHHQFPDDTHQQHEGRDGQEPVFSLLNCRTKVLDRLFSLGIQAGRQVVP